MSRALLRTLPRTTLSSTRQVAAHRTYATEEEQRKYVGISNSENRTRLWLGLVAAAGLGYYAYAQYAPGPPSPPKDAKDRAKSVIGQAESELNNVGQTVKAETKEALETARKQLK